MAEEELPVPVDKIKKEKVTPLSSPVREEESRFEEIAQIFRPEPEEESALHSAAGDTIDPSNGVDEKKETGPVKTSDEILMELFQVFNAAPPDDEKSRSKKKHKKHKKKSKKKKKDSKSGLSDISDSEEDEKVKRKSKDKVRVKKEKLPEGEEPHRMLRKVKREKRSRSRERSPSRRKADKETNQDEVEKPNKESDKSDPKKTRKIIIRNLKDSQVIAEAESSLTAKRQKRRASSSLSLSDEETYEKERHSRPTRTKRPLSPNRDRRDTFRDSYRDSRRSSRRSPSRMPEDMRERIDKKKLLEIARKNAMHMMKNGQLPGSALRQLEAVGRNGGKSIGELTDFCKKLSNGEVVSDLSSLSSGDSDHDREGNSKAFNHPFILKDRGPIVMNIRNSVPLPTRSVDQTNAILQAFPVSSGQQHRQSEMEWVPVEPSKLKAIEAPPPPTGSAKPAAATKKPETVTTVAVISPSGSGSNSSSTPASSSSTVPTNNSVQPPSGPQMNHPPAFITYPPLRTYPNAHVEPLQPPPQPPAMLSDTVFSAPPPVPASLDVSTIISQRLNAMRKLQENPNDNSAMALMENSQKSMSNWATSKFTPGKFLGSTGANILSAKQLQAGGTQAWARKDAFINSAPLSGGKGMHLLQKMGWKPGEALGKEKTGSLEPLLLEVKLDRKGLIAEEEGPQRKKRPPPAVGGSRNMQMSQQFMESKHPVSLLGELASKRKWGAPMYEVVHESGPHHHKSFVYQVIMNGMAYTPAVPCTTKKEAKKLAAQVCLEQLGVLATQPNPH